MEKSSKSTEDLVADPDFFSNMKISIERELEKMKKIVNNISQMRVEAAYLESDLLMVIDAPAWQQISELIRPAPMNIETNQETME